MSGLLDWVRTLLHDMLAWMEGFADTAYGDAALFTFAFAEASFFPVPPDVLLIALCLGQPERSLYFALVCTVGSVLGGMFGYGIGIYGGRPVMKKLFSGPKIAAVEAYYERFNAWATAIGGLTPLPYKIFTVAGGVFAVSFKIFVVASLLARGLRFLVVAILIYFYGEPIRTFIDQYLGLLSIAFVVLLIGGYLLVARGFGHASKQGATADSTVDEATGD